MSEGERKYAVPIRTLASVMGHGVVTMTMCSSYEDAAKIALAGDAHGDVIYEMRRVGTVERSATVKRSES